MTKILLVEDDKSLREIYGVRLLAEGYDIVSAGDGEEALAMAIKERPQLIVSDVMMPKISGFDMLDILRSTTETKNIKVIMMTALSSEDQRARGQALGADRYLVKSQVGIEDVVRTVHEVLADAPVSRTSPAQQFNAAASNTPQRSTPPAMPHREPAPVYQTSSTSPARPSTTPTPSFGAAPAAQRPAASPLPQPTAPFSTPRPANLGDRIIHPVAPSPLPKPDLGALMDQELKGAQTPHNTPMPAAPPQPAVPTQPTAPAQPVAPAPQPMPSQPQPVAVPAPSQMHGATAINFDEPTAPVAPAAPTAVPSAPVAPSTPPASAPRI